MSGSCRLTSRVALSGICPASRDRACAAIVAVRPMVTASSSSARRSRPRTRPLIAFGRARRPWRRPHRVVSFISVVGWGTFPPSGIRQNRQEIESLISAHRLS